MTPIIDREVFFGNPEIIGGQLSPDGKYMAFIKPYQGVRNIWIKPTHAPFDEAIPVTADTSRPIPSYFWTWDSQFLLYVQDKGGNENFHVYAINPFQGEKLIEEIPEARNLTPIEQVRAVIYHVSKLNPDKLYVGINDRDPSWHDLYELSVSTGNRRLIRKNDAQIADWFFDLDDQIRLAEQTTEDGGVQLLKFQGEALLPIFKCSWEESFSLVKFHTDGERVYMVTNKGHRNLSELVLFNVITQELENVESDPAEEVDFGHSLFSEITNELLATIYNGDKPRYYFRDQQLENDYKWLNEQLPAVEVSLGSTTKDESLWLIHATSDVDPGATYLFDRGDQSLSFQYRPRPNLPIEHLAVMQPIRYQSLDGLEIPAYLTIPKDAVRTSMPAILLIHGGPWARDYWGYDSFAQFLANRGYVVLQPNFRGSTGYGKTFLNAGNGEWGRAMQYDISAGVQYLINQGIADPKRIGIMGGSYGGYATLAGLTFTPELYAAGVSIVGPSNLMTLLNSIPPYWEAIRNLFYKRIGDPNTPTGRENLHHKSPLFFAKNIQVPLLVVQGANDPRVKQAESDQIVVAMRELGLPVEYIVAEDEGHGFARPENINAFIAATERFLAKHLYGRYQEDIPKPLAERLEEMTINIDEVTLSEGTTTEYEWSYPIFAVPLHAGKLRYKMVIETGDQVTPFEVIREISELDGSWKICDEAHSLMGEIKDQVVLNKPGLMPVQQEIIQGPATISIAYQPRLISGTVKMEARELTFKLETTSQVMGAGIARNLLLGLLPLENNDQLTYLSFNPQMQKNESFQLSVIGREQIAVAGGAFNAVKIENKSLDGPLGTTILWFSDDDKRLLLKSHAHMPQLGGTQVVVEYIEQLEQKPT